VLHSILSVLDLLEGAAGGFISCGWERMFGRPTHVEISVYLFCRGEREVARLELLCGKIYDASAKHARHTTSKYRDNSSADGWKGSIACQYLLIPHF
jgi:hypothetical protein